MFEIVPALIDVGPLFFCPKLCILGGGGAATTNL